MSGRDWDMDIPARDLRPGMTLLPGPRWTRGDGVQAICAGFGLVTVSTPAGHKAYLPDELVTVSRY